MDLTEYRKKPIEQERVRSLLDMLPAPEVESVIDIGARDGYITLRLAERFAKVTALDLAKPAIDHPRVECVGGDVTSLAFPDGSFDAALCAEVLEHIPPPLLPGACAELARVVRRFVLVGVPYRQDTRVGRTTCRSCGRPNPPWGHVNRFDEHRLAALFAGCTVRAMGFIGTVRGATNPVSMRLMDMAGNPDGVYNQDEHCIHCGATLVAPAQVGPGARALARMSYWIRRVQDPLVRPHANWIHVLFEKPPASA